MLMLCGRRLPETSLRRRNFQSFRTPKQTLKIPIRLWSTWLHTWLRNLDANDTGCNVGYLTVAEGQLLTLVCLHRNFLSLLNCANSVILLTSWLIIKNASSYSRVHYYSASFFRIDQNCAQIFDKSGTNFFSWLTAPRNDLSKVGWSQPFGNSLYFALYMGNASTWNFVSQPFFFVHAISHLSAICKFALSTTSTTSRTFYICTGFSPFVTIEMSY